MTKATRTVQKCRRTTKKAGRGECNGWGGGAGQQGGPDTRLAFAVLAIGMIVGALALTPQKDAAKLISPMARQAAANR